MGEKETQKIISLFTGLNCDFKILKHEPVLTSEQAAKVRNTPLEEGVKSMLFKTRTEPFFYCVVNVPAHKKVDAKKLSKLFGKGSLTLASPEETINETGCITGSVPPLMHEKEIPLFVDEEVFSFNKNSFNAGQRTASIVINSIDLKKAFQSLNAVFGSFSK
ncbi:MAG: YbaK/EbsC family protein [Candidatus Diapherotrites archaeon]